MAEKSFDLEGMFREIELIYKKYNMPKTMGFVPDKLEIILERKETDRFDLTYNEFFNYLPNDIRNIAIEQAMQLLRQIGFSMEKMSRIGNGVKVQISGDFQILHFPIIEILIQSKDKETETKSILDSISKTYKIFADLIEFHWNWNDESEGKIKNSVKISNEILREHPSISEEIEAVIKKYTAKKSS